MQQGFRRTGAFHQDPDSVLVPFGLRVVGNPPAETVVLVRGEVDLLSAPALADLLEQHLPPPGRSPALVTDLSAATFVGARGLAVLLAAGELARHRGTAFRVVGCDGRLVRILEVVGGGDAFTARAC